MKVLWIDTETTGLDPVKQDIITMAFLVEINGEEKDRLYLECQPFDYTTVQAGALQVNGFTVEKLKTLQTPQEAYRKLITFLNKYCDKYDKFDKMLPAGHNIPFDIDFLKHFFLKNRDSYLFSYLDYHKLDTMTLALMLKSAGLENYSNVKLETLAASIGYKEPLHNSLNDIVATRAYYKKIISRIKYVKE